MCSLSFLFAGGVTQATQSLSQWLRFPMRLLCAHRPARYMLLLFVLLPSRVRSLSLPWTERLFCFCTGLCQCSILSLCASEYFPILIPNLLLFGYCFVSYAHPAALGLLSMSPLRRAFPIYNNNYYYCRYYGNSCLRL